MSIKPVQDLTVFCFRRRRLLFALAAVSVVLLWYSNYEAALRNKRFVSVLRNAISTSHLTPKRGAKLALFIQAYERTIPMLPSLMEAIWHPDNIYAIHIDKRTPPELMEPVHRLLDNANYSSNVHLIPRQYVTYLAITTVLNTLNGMSFLLDQDDTWDYFINLSGADYPLVTPDQMRDVFGHPEVIDKKLSFVQTTNYSNAVTGKVYNNRFYRVPIDSATYSVIRPHDPYGEETMADPCIRGCLHTPGKVPHPLFESEQPLVHIVKSEAWIILHRSAAEYAVHSGLSRQLIAFFANVHVPEEFFFSTLLTHAEEIRDSIVHDGFRLVLWGLFNRGSRPPAIDSGDIPDIENTISKRGGLFVRKRMKVDSDIRSYIDDNLLGISERAQTNDTMRKSSEMFSRKQRIRVLCSSRHHVGVIFSTKTYPQYLKCLKESLKKES
ncbi:Xylosyltransferase family GT14 [Gracilaria domingensis]|nr:Xylosyltransferase family GT14 [Gracilaria domingensis]